MYHFTNDCPTEVLISLSIKDMGVPDDIGALARANFERGTWSEIRYLRDELALGLPLQMVSADA